MPMLSALVSSSILAAAGAVLAPSAVPARDLQEATLRLERAGMVRLAAQTEHGMACTVVDHLRGPFASSGAPGRSDCRMDLLLDPGAYRLRLSGPPKGKGTARLSATPFQETNAPVARLDPGRAVEQRLASGQQASFWIHVDARRYVVLRARGRTAGAVHLWRDGDWREGVRSSGGQISPVSGQPIYDWRLQTWLEKGDYLLTVYGTEPLRWTNGSETDTVFVSNGFPELPITGTLVATLPASGVLTAAVPLDSVVAVVELARGGTGATDLSLFRIDKQGVVSLERATSSCRIEARAQMPSCSVHSTGAASHVLEVRGVPGTELRLRAARFASSTESHRLASPELEYGRPQDSIGFRVARAASYDVEIRDVPADSDAAPLACMLVDDTAPEHSLVGRDYWRIDADRAVERSFNYNGSREVLGFELIAGRDAVITTSGGRRSKCELYRLDGVAGRARTRVASPPDGAKACRLEASLAAGTYELHLNSGNAGIETVRIGSVGSGSSAVQAPRQDYNGKPGCSFSNVQLRPDRTYRVLASRVGAIAARGLAVRPVGSRPSTLAWSLPSGPLPEFSPRPTPLPRIEAGAAAFFDFDRGETRSLLFDVSEAGLYSFSTEGLLATECRLRTPSTPELAGDRAGGRGRNCLVEAYLRPGRYLATASTAGQSRGRAGVRLLRRAPRQAPDVAAGGQSFYRAAAGELVRQQLTVGSGGPIVLETHAPGATLACRLEDRDGWPIVAVPSSCTLNLTLAAGRYTWIQMPLSVDSQRQTRLEHPRKRQVLIGAWPHPIAFNTPYTVKLDRSGKDEFLIDVPAQLDVHFDLDNQVQGRLYRIEADVRPQTPIEVISPRKGARRSERARASIPVGADDEPADETAASAGDAEAHDGAGQDESESASEGGETAENDGADESGGGDGGERAEESGDGDPGESEDESSPGAAPLAPAIRLDAGRYRLITQHLEGNTHVTYHLTVTADDLAPGMARDIRVPFRARLRVPSQGVLRLLTEGHTDVRCRVFRAGELVFESSGFGEDWNCNLAEPIAAGDYELVVEPEALAPGPSRVLVSMPSLRPHNARRAPEPAQGPARNTDSAALMVNEQPLELALPPVSAGAALAVVLTSKEPFALALLDSHGRAIERRTATRDGSFILPPGSERHRLLLWTLQGTARVAAGVTPRPVIDVSSAGALPRRAVARVAIPRPGRYTVAPGVLCLGAGETGVLRPCSPEVSLDAGPALFASTSGQDGRESLGLSERLFSTSGPWTVTVNLDRRPFIEAQKSAYNAVHLMTARVASGSTMSPACSFSSGVRALGDLECVAASDAGPEGVARISIDAAAAALELTRVSVPLPARVQSIGLGSTTVSTTARLQTPRDPWQVELVMPPQTWAIQLTPSGKALDFCPPAGGMSSCLLSSETAGEILLWSPREAQAVEARLIAGLARSTVRLTNGLFELAPTTSGSLRLPVPAASSPRFFEVTGASGCAIRDAGGTRYPGCQAHLPPGQSFEVAIDHGRAPLRVALSAVGSQAPSRDLVLFPPPSLSDAAPLDVGRGVLLSGRLISRRLILREASVLSLRADSGVCAIFGVNEARGVAGMGEGCSLSRLLDAGEYRVAVRSFADRPLFGSMSVSRRPVATLGEGVGVERIIAPDETQLFRFQMKASGRLGLGLAVDAETLDCTVLDSLHRPLGVGCQQLLALERGTYILAISAPRGATPARFRPVLLGTEGGELEVPPEYLEDLRQRIGTNP